MIKKSKDVLLLCQYFYPEYISSATLPYDTAAALKSAGYQVGVLCGYPREYSNITKVPVKEKINGIEIKRVKYLQLSRVGKAGRMVNFFSFTFKALLNLHTLSHYKVIIVYSDPPVLPIVSVLAKKLYKCKVVFVAYDLYPEIAIVTDTVTANGTIVKIMKLLNKKVFHNLDVTIALSNEMKKYIASNRPVNKEKIVVIPNWYEDKGEPETVKEDNKFYRTLQNKFVVSYFGNMGTAEDMDTILNTIRYLKNDRRIFFLFAGHGNKMEKLKKIVRQENLNNIKIFEFLQGKDFQDALEMSDAAVISLEKGLTGLCVPSKAYSYMMRGLPLFVIMESSDLVYDAKSGAGFQIENGNYRDMASKIIYLREHSDEYKKMRKKCRELFLKKYETKISTGKYVKLIDRLINNEPFEDLNQFEK